VFELNEAAAVHSVLLQCVGTDVLVEICGAADAESEFVVLVPSALLRAEAQTRYFTEGLLSKVCFFVWLFFCLFCF
jgi:hypothetical protein